MTSNHSFTVEWKPDGKGGRDIDTTLNCTAKEFWDGITVLLISFIEETGLPENVAVKAAIDAVHHAKRYLDRTIGDN